MLGKLSIQTDIGFEATKPFVLELGDVIKAR